MNHSTLAFVFVLLLCLSCNSYAQSDLKRQNQGIFGIRDRELSKQLIIELLEREKSNSSAEIDVHEAFSQARKIELAAVIPHNDIVIQRIIRRQLFGELPANGEAALRYRLAFAFPDGSPEDISNSAQAIVESIHRKSENYYSAAANVYASLVALSNTEGTELRQLVALFGICALVYKDKLPPGESSYSSCCFRLCTTSDEVAAHGFLGLAIEASEDKLRRQFVQRYMNSKFEPIAELPAGSAAAKVVFSEEEIQLLFQRRMPESCVSPNSKFLSRLNPILIGLYVVPSYDCLQL